MSRDKGKRGELEVVFRAVDSGLSARRTAPLQAASDSPLPFGDVLIREFPDLWLEVKRDERMSVDAMVRQAEADAPEGHTPVVAWRRNNRPWSVVVPLSFLFGLLARSHELEGVISD